MKLDKKYKCGGWHKEGKRKRIRIKARYSDENKSWNDYDFKFNLDKNKTEIK